MAVDISGDTLRVGDDGHIRHPTESDLVWWEDADGNRFWVRQSRWYKEFDVKTERNPSEILRLSEQQLRGFAARCEEDGIRIKRRLRKPDSFNAPTGPWENADG